MRGPDGKVVVTGFGRDANQSRRLLRSDFTVVKGFRRDAENAPELTGREVLLSGLSDQRTSVLMEVAA